MMLLEEDPDTVFRPKRSVWPWRSLWSPYARFTGFIPGCACNNHRCSCFDADWLHVITDAFQRIEWKPIFLIAGMWPLTIAIQKTGLAENVIQSVIPQLGRSLRFG